MLEKLILHKSLCCCWNIAIIHIQKTLSISLKYIWQYMKVIILDTVFYDYLLLIAILLWVVVYTDGKIMNSGNVKLHYLRIVTFTYPLQGWNVYTKASQRSIKTSIFLLIQRLITIYALIWNIKIMCIYEVDALHMHHYMKIFNTKFQNTCGISFV